MVMRLVARYVCVTAFLIICFRAVFFSYGPSVFLSELLIGTLPQDDTRLISYIEKYFLWPPSYDSYNLNEPNSVNYSEYHIEPILLQIFNGRRRGVFFEAGAYDGEEFSTTLYLEKTLSWTGVLVEPIPEFVERIKFKNRRAWLSPTCLSLQPYPTKVEFSSAGMLSSRSADKDENKAIFFCNKTGAHGIVNLDEVEKILTWFEGHGCYYANSRMMIQCLPLYSILLATGHRRIDFFTLDVEGAELPVIKTIPFSKVDIKVMLIEVDKLENKTDLVEELKKHNYKHVTQVGQYNLTKHIPHDYLFIKQYTNS